ncbi:hypothetical protein Pryu01_01296 [Paraliobacillus ryukyuensis]|uniref:Tetratricopeptide repeat protein n=1 Tax=Paraliobacillus ryukyuensis TaxID=200904 RepID=A0A366EAL8_9BACI|nr:hypothetical protein [Paraliobacillus ryukyuensis]RBO99470.1 hypothetical protein DES48_104145 [Paraliobacillus ryukyuensis]
MEQHDKKIVLFPKWKEKIEARAFQALRNKRFEEALENLNTLLDYQVSNQEIDIAKLTCLIELGRQREAELLCEELLTKKDDHYFAYVHIYATLLFQANKYEGVAELIEDVFEDENTIPEPYLSQLTTLRSLNSTLLKQQTDQQLTVTLKQLKEAVEKQDDVMQWHLVNHLNDSDISLYNSIFLEMLKDEEVNPIVKTVIISLLQANTYDELIEIVKFSDKMYINPNDFPYMTDHPFYQKIKKELETLEQDNPSLHALADQLLYRYFFVVYPFINEDMDISLLKEAIIYLVSASFMDEEALNQTKIKESLALYIEDLLYYEKVYFSLMKE